MIDGNFLYKWRELAQERRQKTTQDAVLMLARG